MLRMKKVKAAKLKLFIAIRELPYTGKVSMGESFEVESKQTYSQLNFRGVRKYGGARSNA